MDWITEHVALGNFLDARAPGLARQVQAVLCLKPGCCDPARNDVEVLCVPLVDGAGNDPERVRDAVAFLHSVVQDGERVLVHCHAGKSRSAGVVARYLVEHRGFDRDAAIVHIAARRKICLSPGIEEVVGAP